MAFSRYAALRSCFRSARPTAGRPQLFRQMARRGYASESHGSAKAGGDAIWAAGSVAVTVPVCWYLISNRPDTSHGHDDHGDSHSESHEEEPEKKSEDESKDESKDEPEAESKDEPKDEPKTESTEDADDKDSESSEDSEDSDGDEKKKGADTPATSDDEGENTKISKKDPKGQKKRIESKNSIKAGEDSDAEGEDKATASKEPAGRHTQSGKQEGLSNTDTKHSLDITNDPSKSKKGEGMPETAKSKGTVEPNRPQPEKAEKEEK